MSHWKQAKCQDCGREIIVPRGYRKGREPFRCGKCHSNAVLSATRVGPPLYVTRGRI